MPPAPAHLVSLTVARKAFQWDVQASQASVTARHKDMPWFCVHTVIPITSAEPCTPQAFPSTKGKSVSSKASSGQAPRVYGGWGEYLQAEEEEEDDRFACPCPQPCLLLIRPVSPSHHCLLPLSDRQAVSPAPCQQSGPLSPPSATTGLRHGLSLPQIPQRLSQQRNVGFTFSS